MPLFANLEEAIASHPRCQRVPAGLFTQLQYLPASEPILMGFCCFSGTSDDLRDAFAQATPEALLALPLALDDQGAQTVSTVRLELAYTASGNLLAMQPIRYEEWVPTPDDEARILDGAEARPWFEALYPLDVNAGPR